MAQAVNLADRLVENLDADQIEALSDYLLMVAFQREPERSSTDTAQVVRVALEAAGPMTAKALAAYLNMSERTVRSWLRRCELRGHVRRITFDRVDHWRATWEGK